MWQNHDGLFDFIVVFTYLIHWLCTDCWHSFTKLCIIHMVFSTVQRAVSWDGECCCTPGFLWFLACKIGTFTVIHYRTHYCRVVIISTKRSYRHDYFKTTAWIPWNLEEGWDMGVGRTFCVDKQTDPSVPTAAGRSPPPTPHPPARQRQGHKINRGTNNLHNMSALIFVCCSSLSRASLIICVCFFCRKRCLNWWDKGWMRCFSLTRSQKRRWKFTLMKMQLRGYHLVFWGFNIKKKSSLSLSIICIAAI